MASAIRSTASLPAPGASYVPGTTARAQGFRITAPASVTLASLCLRGLCANQMPCDRSKPRRMPDQARHDGEGQEPLRAFAASRELKDIAALRAQLEQSRSLPPLSGKPGCSSGARRPRAFLPRAPACTGKAVRAIGARMPRGLNAAAGRPAHCDMQYIRQSISGRRARALARRPSSGAASLRFDNRLDLLHRLVMLDRGAVVGEGFRDLGLQPALIAVGLLGRLEF